MKYLILLMLLPFGKAWSQGNGIAIIDGRRVELDKVVYSKNDNHEGFGYYSYSQSGMLRFIKHGFVTERGAGEGDYRKGNYVNDLLEGEGEEQLGNYRYVGEYAGGLYDGIGRLTNLRTQKMLYGYFKKGKFVRPIKSYGPYLCPCLFLDSGTASARTAPYADPYNGRPGPFRSLE